MIAVRKRSPTARRGILSMELVLTLPIVATVLFALLEFSLLFYARGLVVEASRVGARVATLPGATPQSVEAEVRRVLSPTLQERLSLDVQLGEQSGDLVVVAVATPMAAASPDLLWPVGFSLQGRSLVSETRMVRE